ncbi:hypothetical protein [Exiguobacterium undae]|uniref:hypothetical protein n=1 Tax=Exiguobacterium undae TaxID=169177 RepID=UPI000479B944|nr:hypothetical protein [Exiguobacterium undae]
MLTSVRLKLGLFLSLTVLVLLVIKSFVPRLMNTFISLFDSKTDSSCTTRCGDAASNMPLPSDPLTIRLDPIVDVVSTEPEPALLRTGFDSLIVAPPYPFIFILLALLSCVLLVYYIKVVRPSHFASLAFSTSRVQVIHYPDHDLPAEDIRQHVLLFNRRLPVALQRREQETITEWFARIEFPSPVSPHYLEVRYSERGSIPLHQLTFFKQTTEDFLRRFPSQTACSK